MVEEVYGTSLFCFVLQFSLICVKHAKFVQFCKLHFVELHPEMHKNSLTYLSTVHGCWNGGVANFGILLIYRETHLTI